MLVGAVEFHTMESKHTVIDEIENYILQIMRRAKNMIVKSLKKLLPNLTDLVIVKLVSSMYVETIKFLELYDSDEAVEVVLTNMLRKILEQFIIVLFNPNVVFAVEYDDNLKKYVSASGCTDPRPIAKVEKAIGDCPRLFEDEIKSLLSILNVT